MPLAEDLGIDDVQSVIEGVFGLEGTAGTNGEYRLLCPIHERDGGHNPSCDVNLKTGQWNCFACSASGDIVGLGKLTLGRPRHKILELLRPNEPTAIAAALQTRVRRKLNEVAEIEDEETATFQPEVPPLGSYKGKPMTELKKRGFLKSTLKHWGVRFAREVTLLKVDSKPFDLHNNIAIPIVGHKGKVVCWCYRATPDSDPWQEDAKYIYTPGLVSVLNRTWFGLHEHRHETDIAVVEGALDAMWCWQNGIPAVAILGSSTKQFEKVDALTDFRSVTILPDRDQPGMISALRLGDRLQEFGTPVRIGLYREWMRGRRGKPAGDPQDLCPIDLELVHGTALPWQVWRSRPAVQELANNLARKDKGNDATRTPRR